MKIVKVAIHDPQFLTRNGVARLVESMEGFQYMGDIPSQPELIPILEKSLPNILVVDYLGDPLFTPDYFARLTSEFPDLGVLIITADCDRKQVLQMVRSGISGFLTKRCKMEEVAGALKAAKRNEQFFCRKTLELIAGQHGVLKGDPLSQREIQIVKLVVEGSKTLAIADHLSISVHTVNSHRKNILRKLKIKSPAQLAVYAAEQGWVPLKNE